MMISRRRLLAIAAKAGVLCTTKPTAFVFGESVFGGRGTNAGEASTLSRSLPSTAKPWVYWFWMRGSITAEGLTADLEAMHDIGIGGAIILNLGRMTKGPVDFLSPKWLELTRYAIAEAARLGLELDLNHDDGWDAGGPWVRPEQAMQKLVWSESQFIGGKTISTELPTPKLTENYYKDVSVFAFRSPVGSREVMPKPNVLFKQGKPSYIVQEFPTAITARGISVHARAGADIGPVPIEWELQVSEDGTTYRPVYRFDEKWRFSALTTNRNIQTSAHFAAITGRFFRLEVPYGNSSSRGDAEGEPGKANSAGGFTLSSEARISLWEAKAGYMEIATPLDMPSRYEGGWTNPFGDSLDAPDSLSAESIIKKNEIIDLTSHVKDGHLEWDAPPGEWLVIRLGHTPTGTKNNAASPEGKGLNVDMLSKSGIESHFPHVAGTVADQSKQYIGKSLKYFHTDSWEAGPQNWTPSFMQEFRSRRGYDMQPYFPVLAGGRTVDSLEISERFLWDFRRTIADLIAENFFGHLGTLCHQRGMRYSNEGAGRGQFMADPLLNLSKADMPMGEFWLGNANVRPDCLLSASVAHVYGKKLVAGEAFTSTLEGGDKEAGIWKDHPFSLKAFGDRAFCAGVNKFVFHRSIHQPDSNAKPGIAWGYSTNPSGVGINMERTQTWWKPGEAWISYLSRCQELLQEGMAVVDVCALMSEGVPNALIAPQGLPPGYKYDAIHAEVLSKITVQNHQLVLPSGMRYRMLTLPNSARMTPQVGSQIARLVDAGAIVSGPRPIASPSLFDREQSDKEIRELAKKYWDGGFIFDSVESGLAHLKLTCDFELDPSGDTPEVLFIHRSIDGSDVYFLSNQSNRAANLACLFRVGKRVPEFMDPDSGKIVESAVYQVRGDRMFVPVHLDPNGSVFVMFRKNAVESVTQVQRDGQDLKLSDCNDRWSNLQVTRDERGNLELASASSGRIQLTSSERRTAAIDLPASSTEKIDGSWTISFPDGWGAPRKTEFSKLMSWTESAEEGVRHFSGSAVYTKTFEVKVPFGNSNRAVYLDLGDVAVIAEITLNGTRIGTRWKPPFRYDVSSLLRSGTNELAITVTNLWPNRLIGDQSLPADKRFTKTNFNPYKKDSPLLSSGLLGPVKLIFTNRIPFRWM